MCEHMHAHGVLYGQKVYPSVFILFLKTNLVYKSQLLIDTSLQSFFSYQYSICFVTMTMAHLSDTVYYTVYHSPLKHLLNKNKLIHGNFHHLLIHYYVGKPGQQSKLVLV